MTIPVPDKKDLKIKIIIDQEEYVILKSQCFKKI